MPEPREKIERKPDAPERHSEHIVPDRAAILTYDRRVMYIYIFFFFEEVKNIYKN